MRARPGITLAELLVAILLLGVGAVALAGSSGWAVRAAHHGRAAAVAAWEARARLESRAAAPCDSAESLRLVRGEGAAGEPLYAVRPC